MPVDELAIRRLVALGRQSGSLTLEQIRAHLPVDRMTEAQIGEALERIEAAGVSVEVDDALLALHSGLSHDPFAAARRPAPEEKPPTGPAYVPRPRLAAAAAAAAQGHASDLGRTQITTDNEPMPNTVPNANRLVAVALVITALLFILGYLLLS